MTSIDRLLSEERLTFAELARTQGVSPNTVWRWAKIGVRGIRLESFKNGGKRVTTRESFHRFIAAISGVPLNDTPSRAKSIAAAEKALARAGI